MIYEISTFQTSWEFKNPEVSVVENSKFPRPKEIQRKSKLFELKKKNFLLTKPSLTQWVQLPNLKDRRRVKILLFEQNFQDVRDYPSNPSEYLRAVLKSRQNKMQISLRQNTTIETYIKKKKKKYEKHNVTKISGYYSKKSRKMVEIEHDRATRGRRDERGLEDSSRGICPFTCGACSLINGYRICEISVSLSVILTTSRGIAEAPGQLVLAACSTWTTRCVASCSSLLHMWTKRPRCHGEDYARRGSTPDT